MAKQVLLVDGDILAYQVAAVLQDEFHFDGAQPASISVGTPADVAELIEARLRSYKAALEMPKAEVVVCLTTGQNYRHALWPDYKANRAGNVKPVLLPEARRYLLETLGARSVVGMEADDLLGILMTRPGKAYRVIVSDDKDMRTVPGRVWAPGRGEDSPTEVSLQQANWAHMLQTLTGDAADGYPGCPGVGPVKAKTYLPEDADVDELWPKVVEVYQEAGLSADDALVQARVAFICRAEYYDPDNRRMRLWKPPMTK